MNDLIRPTIGIIGSPALAGTLQAHGLAEIISGTDDEAAAAAIESALRHRSDLSMIIVVTDATVELPELIVSHSLRPRQMITLVDGNRPEHRFLLDNKALNARRMPVPLNILMGELGHPSTAETMSLWLTPDGQQVISRGGPTGPQPNPASVPTAASASSPVHAAQRALPQDADSEVVTPQSQPTPPPVWVDEREQRDTERERLVDEMDHVRLIGQSEEADTGFLADVPRQQGYAPVLFVGAPKGGVGKSTSAIALAHRAAQRSLRVVWVEADVEHPQAAHHFGLERTAALPTVMDYHLHRTITAATVSPGTLQEYRHNPKQPQFGFGAVLAPTEAELKKGYISASTYREMIKKLRRQVDLVVVDLHQFTSTDPLGMMDNLVLPMVRDDSRSWLMLVNDASRTGLAGVDDWVVKWTANKVDSLPASRIITVQNDIPVDPENGKRLFAATANGVAETLARHSFYAGTVWRDDSIIRHTNQAIPIGDHPVWRYPLDQVLARVLGLPIESDPYDPYQKQGFFARTFGRKQ